jgi:GT2 family glycosyltransferase
MKLDILVVSFHAKKELAQTLASIALYSAPGYRLTVHDNTPKNYSLTWLWNKFMERNKCEFVAFVNSDVVVGPGWDTEAIALLQSNPAIANVSPVSNYDPHRRFAPIPEPNEHALDWIEGLTEGLKQSPTRFHTAADHTLAAGHCMIMKKSLNRQVGGFNEKFPFANNDFDLNERFIKAGYQMGVCLHATSLHWWNASTKDAMAKGLNPVFHPGAYGASFETEKL